MNAQDDIREHILPVEVHNIWYIKQKNASEGQAEGDYVEQNSNKTSKTVSVVFVLVSMERTTGTILTRNKSF